MSEKYLNKAQSRGYQVLKALFGHEVSGISLTELAERVGINKSQVVKDLAVLEQEGLAEQLSDKNWRLSSSLGREAFKILNAVDSARKRVEEAANRYGVSL